MRGICFIEPLFLATVDGRKKMTRRRPDKSGKPKYHVDEVLYLKETYGYSGACEPGELVVYKYGLSFNELVAYAKGGMCELHDGWRNKLYMPARAARYFIRITAVRMERLQEITEADCMKEGIRRLGEKADFNYYHGVGERHFNAPREAFAALIDITCGRGTWESNSQVAVYEFELTDKPITL
ncbi:MAG: hypothetical protein LBH06_00850 [Rikenellaceae bacterium]|jgi:hypothetical protein|nr:hypothetical protein [Rikenellaceae bacterium]